MVCCWTVFPIVLHGYRSCQTNICKPTREGVSGSSWCRKRDSRFENVSFVSCAGGGATTISTVVLVDNSVGTGFPPSVHREVISLAMGVREVNLGSVFGMSPTDEFESRVARVSRWSGNY